MTADGKLFHKFNVSRTDGSSEPGGKHDGCDYFVLDATHDKHAKSALQAYAASCQSEYPELARDMRARYGLSATNTAATGAVEGEQLGYVVLDDDGWEWHADDPIESGECQYPQEPMMRMTADQFSRMFPETNTAATGAVECSVCAARDARSNAIYRGPAHPDAKRERLLDRRLVAEPQNETNTAATGMGELPELPNAGMQEVNPYLGMPTDPYGGKHCLVWYTADQMRAYAITALAAQPAPVVGGDAVQAPTIVAMLVAVARAAHYAMDDCGDLLLTEEGAKSLSDALDALDGLPEIEDGYTRDGWCLAKDHIALLSARPAESVAQGGEWQVLSTTERLHEIERLWCGIPIEEVEQARNAWCTPSPTPATGSGGELLAERPVESVVGDVDGVARLLADAAGHGMREKCEPLARQIVELLAARPGGEGETVASGGESVVDRAIYDYMCAADNQDVPLERWPARIVKALAMVGYAVVPCQIPFEVLGEAQRSGVFETGNPTHGWDYLIGKTRVYLIAPNSAHPAQAGGEVG